VNIAALLFVVIVSADLGLEDQVVPEGSSGDLFEADYFDLLAQKQGMNANSKVPYDVLDLFTDTSSWFWTYGLEPSRAMNEEDGHSPSLDWGINGAKEFVPLINLKQVLPKWHPNSRCTFRGGDAPDHLIQLDKKDKKNKKKSKPAGPFKCKVDDIVDVLEKTKASIDTHYLMGYNEPYADHEQDSAYASKSKKGVTPEEGAEWWRLFVQPAAERTNLKLVSPTTGISSQKVGWLHGFLQACYEQKDANPPCTVEKIEVFSVHEYKCYADYWRKYAARDGGEDVTIGGGDSCEERFKPRGERNIFTSFKSVMSKKYQPKMDEEDMEPWKHYNQTFWDDYIDRVKLWVTETSCSGDFRFDKSMLTAYGGNYTKKSLPATPTPEQSCLDIAGQSCHHKEGSVAAMLELDTIERISWFTLFPNPPIDHPNYASIRAAAMVEAREDSPNYKDPTPVGRALLGGLSQDVDCSASL
jgi:hypothetical protein